MRSILFVDDERNVLDGLQRMLRPMRHEWEMRFADDGPSALASLAEKPCEVVVTDMRMPGMDGAQLLNEVRTHYPGTVRIVLSGHSEREMVMKSVGPAHQYLSKPCDAEILKATVSRACALRDLLAEPHLKLLVSEMASLPSLPSSCAALLKEFETADPSTKRVGEIISRDPGMTAKMLQLVNSAFFGLRRHINTASEAVGLIGLDITRALVLSVEIFSEFNIKGFPELSYDTLWKHSLTVATTAKAIAKAEGAGSEIADTAFTAGLLHESGRLVLASRLPTEYRQAIDLAREEGISMSEAEQRIFKTGHPEAGAYLLGLWGLPNDIVEAIAFHNCPGASSILEFGALAAVHIANIFDTVEVGVQPSPVDTGYLSAIGRLERLPVWEKLYQDTLAKLAGS